MAGCIAAADCYVDDWPVRMRHRRVYAMQEQFDVGTTLSIGGLVVAGAVATFRWLIGREVARHDEERGRVDDHEHRISELERTMLTRSDLDRAEGRVIAAIGEVRQSVASAHERIDRITERR